VKAEEVERKGDRRKGVSSHFTSPVNDRRRPQFERRSTVPQAAPLTREQLVYGERRQNPKER
jgi:hypothetical protein